MEKNLKGFMVLLLLLFNLMLIAQEQTQQTQTKIAENQLQTQQQIQQDFSDRIVNILPAVAKVMSAKKKATTELDTWYKATVDSIEIGLKTDMTLAQLEKLREDKYDEIIVNYHTSIEYLVARNKRKQYRIFPAFNGYMSMLYYNAERKFEFFENTNLSFGNDNGSFESEIVSGYLWIIRTSLSTVLSKESTEKIDPESFAGVTPEQANNLILENEKINLANNTLLKIISGGGEANLKFKVPFLNFWGDNKRNINLKSDFSGRISGNLPLAGNSIEGADVNFFTTFGLENKLVIPIINFTSNKKQGYEAFSLFGKYDIRNVGGTSKFYQSLSIPENRFWYSEYSIGLTYTNIVIYFTDQTFSSKVLKGKNKSRLGVGLIKQF